MLKFRNNNIGSSIALICAILLLISVPTKALNHENTFLPLNDGLLLLIIAIAYKLAKKRRYRSSKRSIFLISIFLIVIEIGLIGIFCLWIISLFAVGIFWSYLQVDPIGLGVPLIGFIFWDLMAFLPKQRIALPPS
jgi:hypothetical protein